MAEKKIEGGYYLKARCIQNSKIATMPPYVREIWDWFLKEANHKDGKSNGTVIKRGQLIRTFKDIQEGLKWWIGWRKMTYKKWQCENATRLLMKATMITTTKTTRGMLVTIINYDTYQNPKNYESNNEHPHERRQTTDTINKNDKNDKKETNIRILAKKGISFTTEEYPHFVSEEFRSLWEAWIEVRERKGIPNTQRALKIALGKLQKEELATAIKMLERAVERGWRGIFSLKEEKEQTKGGQYGRSKRSSEGNKYKNIGTEIKDSEPRNEEERKKVADLIHGTILKMKKG